MLGAAKEDEYQMKNYEMPACASDVIMKAFCSTCWVKPGGRRRPLLI